MTTKEKTATELAVDTGDGEGMDSGSSSLLFSSTIKPRGPIAFPGCATPTLGVELELSLVNNADGQIVAAAPSILNELNDEAHYKAELFRTIVELNTDVCSNVEEVRRDLGGRIRRLQEVCTKHDLSPICVGTHPTADWRMLPITDAERYRTLVQNMQWPARRLLICGVHVHVGVKSGEHAIAIMNALTVFIPHLLAISSSSPYWSGADTGMASARVKIFEGLPTAGLPPKVVNWREFVQLMRTLLTAHSIASIREIWWDVRPHTGFGTLEVRVCDGVNTLDEVCAITAFVQSLVVYLQCRYDRGEPLPQLHDWTLRENKWRAARWGLEASLIRNERGDQVQISEHITDWIALLQPTAEELGCASDLSFIHTIIKNGPSYKRQRQFVEDNSIEALSLALSTELRDNTPLIWP